MLAIRAGDQRASGGGSRPPLIAHLRRYFAAEELAFPAGAFCSPEDSNGMHLPSTIW